MPARLSSMELSPADADAGAQPSRRKSGRVTRQPEFLSPSRDVRMRDDDEGSDDDGDEDDEEDGDGEADEEEMREQRKRKRGRKTAAVAAPAKRARVNGAPSAGTATLAIRSAGGKRKGKVRKGALAAAEGVGGLYGSVFAADEALDAVAAHWLERFDAHEAGAVAELVNFLLRCAGCEITVDEHDVLDVDNVAGKLQDIQDEFQAQNVTEYPLVARDKSGNAFRQHLTSFFNTLVQTLSAKGHLAEKRDLIDNIQTWVATMSAAASRPFRHTGTVVALEIVSAMAELSRGLVDTRAKTLRQAEGEQKNKKVNRARVKDLQQGAETKAAERKLIDEQISDWFDTVFVHRYRDIDPRIRVDSVVYLSDWIATYPEHFLDGAHLRYLGWMLSDTASVTRHEVTKRLQKIFADENNVGGLRQFTERFRTRMVEMATRDGDLGVRCSAVELLDVLRERGLLEPDDIDTIGKLMFDAEPRVRKAVTPFFVASVQDSYQAKIDDFEAEALEDFRSSETDEDYESPRLDWFMFKALAELMQSYDSSDDSAAILDPERSLMDDVTVFVHSRVSLAADAMYAQLPVLQEWEALAGYLLTDLSHEVDESSDDIATALRAQCKLNDREEAILLDVLNVSVKQNLSEVVDEGGSKKPKKSKAQLRELQDLQEAAAQQLAILIPRLLNKFGSAPETASAVLRLEHVLNLGIFQELQQDNTTYAELLKKINDQFMSHESSNVINEAKTALLHAKSFEELQEVTDGKLEALWEDTLHNFGRQLYPVRSEVDVRCSLEPRHLSQLSSTLLRMANLSSISDCTKWLDAERSITGVRKDKKSAWNANLLDTLLALLGRAVRATDAGIPRAILDNVELGESEDALVGHALRTLLFFFMWTAAALRGPSAAPLPAPRLARLLDLRARTFAATHRIMRRRRAADALRCTAAGTLLELATLLSTLAGSAPRLAAFDSPTALLPQRLQRAVLAVFAAAERDFARKAGKNLPAPADDDDDPLSSDDGHAAEQDDDDPTNADPLSSDDDDEGPADDDGQHAPAHARAHRRHRAELLAEQALCALAGKMVLASVAGVLPQDVVATRLRRNVGRLGPNFRDVVAVLGAEEKKTASKGKKGKPVTRGASAPAGEVETVEEDGEGEGEGDDEGEEGVEEDGEEDLRRRELLVEAPPDDEALREEREASVQSVLGD